jgi:hypothetical protein
MILVYVEQVLNVSCIIESAVGVFSRIRQTEALVDQFVRNFSSQNVCEASLKYRREKGCREGPTEGT